MSGVLLVGRHPAAMAFCRTEIVRLAPVYLALRGEVNEVAHLDTDALNQLPAAVVGVLPLPLLAWFGEHGVPCFALVLPAVRAEDRGRELAPDEMRAAGAHLLAVQLTAAKV